jgi:hypothetical protein
LIHPRQSLSPAPDRADLVPLDLVPLLHRADLVPLDRADLASPVYLVAVLPKVAALAHQADQAAALSRAADLVALVAAPSPKLAELRPALVPTLRAVPVR